MKILQLQRHLRHDLVASCHPSCRADAHRTLRHLETRFENEGFPFLTKLGLAYKAALGGLCRHGNIPDVLPHLGPGFSRVHEWGADTALRFLGLLSWPSKLTFAGESEGHADWSGFVERSLSTAQFNGLDWETRLPLSAADQKALRRWTIPRDSFGKHGPGATAERLIGWDKWLALDQPTRPLIRMTSVPKDRLKRRLIGIEHAKMQFIQQGLAASLRSTAWFRRWVTLEDQRRHIAFAASGLGSRTSFGDPNGRCTIDLSDASDRIPLSLVEYLLPEWYPALATASSSYASLPTEAGIGQLVPLGMMATMGNGFCFELETLMFHIVASICGRIYDDESGLPKESLEHYAARVRVYGDDVIAPVAWFPVIERVFTQIGWRINDHKTAITDRFLETCGTYITPQAQLKRLCPTLATEDVMGQSRSLSWKTDCEQIACAHAFLDAGFPLAAKEIARPVIDQAKYRWNHSFHRYEIKLSGVVENQRPLSVTDETRLHAYWVTGLTSRKRRMEGMGTFRIRAKWIPWDIVKPVTNGSTAFLPAFDNRADSSNGVGGRWITVLSSLD